MGLGIALGGGGAIYVSGIWGFNTSLLFVSGLLLLYLAFAVLFIKDPDCKSDDGAHKPSTFAHFAGTLGAFVRSLHVGFMQSGGGPKLGLMFALLPIGAMALAYAILGTLQVDYGLKETSIAEISILNTVAAGIGCVIGGILGDKFGMKKVVGLLYFLTTLPTIFLAALILIPFLKNREETVEIVDAEPVPAVN